MVYPLLRVLLDSFPSPAWLLRSRAPAPLLSVGALLLGLRSLSARTFAVE